MRITINKTKVVNLISLFLILTVLFEILKPQADAASAADFYKGKRISFISTEKAGGHVGLLARTIAPYLKKYTGALAVVVDDVEGGGGLIALNRLWNSKPDGLTVVIGQMNLSVTLEGGKMEGVQFQSDKLNVIFAPISERGRVIVVNPKSPFHTVDDIKKAKGLKSAGPWGMAVPMAFFADILGLDAKVSPGVPKGDARLALRRGEIDYMQESPGEAFAETQDGELRALCVLNVPSLPDFPQLPSVMKFVTSLSTQQKEWIQYFSLVDEGKYIFAGPNLPKERIEYLRTSFEKTYNDPQFLKDREKINLERGTVAPWLNGAEAQKRFTSYRNQAIKLYIPMVEYLSKKYFTTK